MDDDADDTGQLSHNCGRPVDKALDAVSKCTVTGTDGIHRLWI